MGIKLLIVMPVPTFVVRFCENIPAVLVDSNADNAITLWRIRSTYCRLLLYS